jgi:4-amino-4-deoxy-L-arabinose transferase-like glycosyltransferase
MTGVDRDRALLTAMAAGLLIGVIALLPGWGRRELWDPDETRYAWVADDMARRGAWFDPHLHGEDYTSKPPPFFWLVAGASALTGDVTTGAPLVSIIAGALTAALVAGLGARLAAPRVGVLAAAVFVSTFQVGYTLRRGMLDPVLTCCATGAALLLVLARDAAGPRRAALQAAAALVAGVGFVVKGPSAFVGPLVVAGALAWPALHEAARAAALGRARPALTLALRALVTSLPACAPMLALGLAIALADGAEQALATGAPALKHPLGMIDKQQGWLYYLNRLPADALPWTLLLPAALAAGRRSAAGRLALAWLLVSFAVYEVFPAKRSVYLVPLYAPLALLVAIALTAGRGRAVTVGLAVVLVALALVGVGAPAAVLLFLHGLDLAPEGLPAAWATAARASIGPATHAASFALGAVVSGAAVVGLRRLRRGEGRAAGAWAGAAAVAASAWIGGVALPLEDARRSNRPLARAVTAAVARGERVAVTGPWPAGLGLALSDSGADVTYVFDPAELARVLDEGTSLLVLREKGPWRLEGLAGGRPYRVEARFAQLDWVYLLRFERRDGAVEAP